MSNIKALTTSIKQLGDEYKKAGDMITYNSIKGFLQNIYQETTNFKNLITDVKKSLKDNLGDTFVNKLDNALEEANQKKNELLSSKNEKIIDEPAISDIEKIKDNIKDIIKLLNSNGEKDKAKSLKNFMAEINKISNVEEFNNKVEETKELLSSEFGETFVDKLNEALTDIEPQLTNLEQIKILSNELFRTGKEAGKGDLATKLRDIANEANKTEKLDEFNEKIKELRALLEKEGDVNLLNEFDKAIEQSNSKLKGFWNNLSTTSKMIAAAFSVRTIKMLFNGLKRAYTNIRYITDASSGFIEDYHLFETTLGRVKNAQTELEKEANKYYEKGIKFQNTLHEKFGTNMADTMKYQGLFNQMARSMDIPKEKAYTLSEGFTKLGYDLSSLYNIDPKNAMQKLRAGLAGQTKPLRDIGLDITQQSLAPKLQDLGIERTVKQLSQAEKMVLRYIVVLEQAKVTHGDFAHTIESPANQLKVLTTQLRELAVAIGNMFLPALKKVLPYINGFVMAIKEVIQFLAILFGYTTELSEGMSTLSDDTEIDLGFDDEIEKAKKLKNATLGFDELNVLKETDSSSNAGLGTIDSRLLDALNDYDNKMGEITMKATEIRDRIMEWLGFTKEVDEETGKVSWKLNDGYTNLEKIRDIMLFIGGIILTNGILGLINKLKDSELFKLIKKVGLWFFALGKTIVLALSGDKGAIAALKKLGNLLKNIFSWILIVIGSFLYFKEVITIVKKGNMNLQDMLKLVGFLGIAVLGVAIAFGGVVAAIVGVVGAIGILATAIYTYCDEILTNIQVGLNWIGAKTMEIFAYIGKAALDVWTNISFSFKKAWYIVLDWLKTSFEKAVVELSKPFENWINDIIKSLNSIITFFGGKGFQELKITETLEKKFGEKQEQRDNEIANIEAERIAKLDELNKDLDKVISKFERQKQENEWKIYDNYLSKKTPEELDKINQAKKETEDFLSNLKSKLPWNNGNDIPQVVDSKETLEETKNVAESTKESAYYLKDIKEKVTNMTGINVDNDEEISTEKEIANNTENFDDFLSKNNLFTEDISKSADNISDNLETNNTLSTNTNTELSSIASILQGEIINAINSVKRACENIRINVTNNYYSSGGSSSSSSSSSSGTKSSSSSLLSKITKAIRGYATGGMPESKSLFYAHENGTPELVGKFGNRTEVMNNEQLIQAVSSGVASAVTEVLTKHKTKTVIAIDGKELLSATEKAKDTRGYNVVGGAFSKG